MRAALRVLGGAGALSLASAMAPAQTPASPPPKPFSFEVAVDVVSVTVVVYDKAGHPIHGLGPSDITVLEDGVPQEVSYFKEAKGGDEKIPLSVVLVLDASGSMKQNLPFLQEAAGGFVRKLEDVDSALVVSFNESIKGSAEFTGDDERLEQFVEGLQAWGGTSLYDAIQYSLDRIKGQAGRKALIVFSDGDDTTSSIKESDVIDIARSVEATIYTIGIQGGGPGGGAPRGFLKKIAAETGGEFFFPDRMGDLLRVFAEISEELHNHYLLSYTPKRAPDGTFRNIQVKLDRKDAQVRVRKGYFAVKRRR